MGYVGYPAHVFYMKVYLDRQDTHFKRLWTLEQWYSDLRGYLPNFLKSSNPTEEDFKRIRELMPIIDKRIDEAWDEYQQRFDEPNTWDPEELVFNRHVKEILRDLDEITAISKVIDKQKMQDEEMVF